MKHIRKKLNKTKRKYENACKTLHSFQFTVSDAKRTLETADVTGVEHWLLRNINDRLDATPTTIGYGVRGTPIHVQQPGTLINCQIWQGSCGHAVWIIQERDGNWSIFNSNSWRGGAGTKELVQGNYFKLYTPQEGRRRGQLQSIHNIQKHHDISPTTCINTAPDQYNPGFCAIFGIVMASFFYHRYILERNSDWKEEWKQILKELQKNPEQPDSFAVQIGNFVLTNITIHDPKTVVKETYRYLLTYIN